MAGLTSREGEAIKKALTLDTMTDLSHKIDQLERLIRGEQSYTEDRMHEAQRILEPKKTVDGSEIRPTGSLFENLVRGLDEAGLISALTAVKGVMADLEAKRAIWLTKAEANLDEAGFLPRKGVDRKTYDDMSMSF